MLRRPGGLGSLVASRKASLRGEDPWLCVTGFRQICLYRAFIMQQIGSTSILDYAYQRANDLKRVLAILNAGTLSGLVTRVIQLDSW